MSRLPCESIKAKTGVCENAVLCCASMSMPMPTVVGFFCYGRGVTV